MRQICVRPELPYHVSSLRRVIEHLRWNARGACLDTLLGYRAADFTGSTGSFHRRVAECAGLDWSEAMLRVRAAVRSRWADRGWFARRADVNTHFGDRAASLACGALDGSRACFRWADGSEAMLCIWAAVACRRADGCLRNVRGEGFSLASLPGAHLKY